MTIIPINQEMNSDERFWITLFNNSNRIDDKIEIIHYLYSISFDDLAEALSYTVSGVSVNLNMYIDNGESNTKVITDKNVSKNRSSFKKIIKKVYSLTKTLFY